MAGNHNFEEFQGKAEKSEAPSVKFDDVMGRRAGADVQLDTRALEASSVATANDAAVAQKQLQKFASGGVTLEKVG